MSGYMSKLGYTWRYWVLQVALVGFVVLSSMSASHDHKSAAESLACAPCHVGGQGTLDVPPVQPTVPIAVLVLLFLFVLPQPFAALPSGNALRPHSRAPPSVL